MKFIIPRLNIYSKRLSVFQERLWEQLLGKPFMGIRDNVAEIKFHKLAYGDYGAKNNLFGVQPEIQKVNIQRSVSVTAFANAAQQGAGGAGAALTTQIDRGAEEYDVTPDTAQDPILAYGYGVAGEWYESYVGELSFGSIDNDTYTDGASTSRVIKGVVHKEPAFEDDFILSLDGTSITNSDATWLDITWDDISGTPRVIDRSADANIYTASLNGSTHWRDSTANFNWSDTDLNTDFVLTTS